MRTTSISEKEAIDRAIMRHLLNMLGNDPDKDLMARLAQQLRADAQLVSLFRHVECEAHLIEMEKHLDEYVEEWSKKGIFLRRGDFYAFRKEVVLTYAELGQLDLVLEELTHVV